MKRRESSTLRAPCAPALPAALSSPRRFAKRERTPEDHHDAPPPPPAPPAPAPAPAPESGFAPGNPFAAWHAAPPPLWPPALAPCAFELFRAEWHASQGGGWAEARRAWLALPADVTHSYQLRAAGAALAAAGFGPAACEAPLATPVLPSRVIAAPMVLPGGVMGARAVMPTAG
jgi:hypothetical protein